MNLANLNAGIPKEFYLVLTETEYNYLKELIYEKDGKEYWDHPSYGAVRIYVTKPLPKG